MAPKSKKPAAPKAAPQKAAPARKAAPVAAKAAAKAAVKPLPKATHAAMHADAPHHHHGEGESCCSTGKTCCGLSCPVFQTITRPVFWLAAVVAFAIIAGTDFTIQTQILMNPNFESTPMRLAQQVLTAMAYSAIVMLINRKDWWGGFVAGLLAATPMAIPALAAYTALPQPEAFLPGVWGAGALVQGGLIGLVVTALLRRKGGSCC